MWFLGKIKVASLYVGIVLYLKVFASIQCQLYWNFRCFSPFTPSPNYMLLMNVVTELPYWGDIATQLNHFLCNFYVPRRKCDTKTIATNRITSWVLFFPFFHFHVDFIALFFCDLANRYRCHWIDLWWLLLWEKFSSVKAIYSSSMRIELSNKSCVTVIEIDYTA